MTEMSMAGKDHFHVMLIAIVDGVLVFYRTSRLNDAKDSRLMGLLYTIGKGEKGVGGQDRVLGIKAKRLGLVDGLF